MAWLLFKIIRAVIVFLALLSKVPDLGPSLQVGSRLWTDWQGSQPLQRDKYPNRCIGQSDLVSVQDHQVNRCINHGLIGMFLFHARWSDVLSYVIYHCVLKAD